MQPVYFGGDPQTWKQDKEWDQNKKGRRPKKNALKVTARGTGAMPPGELWDTVENSVNLAPSWRVKEWVLS